MKDSTQGDSYLTVGPATYCKGGTIRLAEYRTGELCIEIVEDQPAEDGDEISYIATVAVAKQGVPDPGEFCVWLKGWSENEGIPAALALAGIVELTGRKEQLNFAEIEHAKLTDLARVHYTRWRSAQLSYLEHLDPLDDDSHPDEHASTGEQTPG